MWAARPHLGSIFVKLLHRKTFWFVQRLSENHAIRKNGLPHPAKGGSTPAFACQHAAIAPLPCLNLQLTSQGVANSELAGFKKCNCSRKSRLQNQFAPQMWAARPHLANIFEKLLDQKIFVCLRLAFYSQHHTAYPITKISPLSRLIH